MLFSNPKIQLELFPHLNLIVAQVWCTCLEKCGLSLQSLMSAAVLLSRTLSGPCTYCLENMYVFHSCVTAPGQFVSFQMVTI